jgi:hypothetical protein
MQSLPKLKWENKLFDCVFIKNFNVQYVILCRIAIK